MTAKKNSPTHTAYQVREFKSNGEDRAIWNRVGSVWAHSDGTGFNIQLDSLPLDGRIVVRPVKEKQPTAEESAE